MPDRDWRLRIQDILESVAKIQRYTAGMSFEEFQADEKTIDAVIRNFEIIGEAARHIPREIQECYPDLPWAEMRGMRDILIHQYFGVSLPIVWHTIQYDLPPLVRELQKILEREA